MKIIGSTFLGLVLAFSARAGIPTPDSALAFDLAKDSRKWIPQPPTASSKGFLEEFVPKGDSIDSWTEMVAQQIVFTSASLKEYLNTWKGMLSKSDPQVDMKEERLDDGSVIVTYTSRAANETSMRRFIKGKDGIYMLAYHVRPAFKSEALFNTWSGILHTAHLIPNPEKKR